MMKANNKVNIGDLMANFKNQNNNKKNEPKHKVSKRKYGTIVVKKQTVRTNGS